MNLKAACVVGRVSNLPTVWTNVLAGAILANSAVVNIGSIDTQVVIMWLGTLLALSLMYLGGMFLNDAFDADWDKQHNNARPIVTGDIKVATVWLVGSGLIVAAIALVSLLYQVGEGSE